MKTTVSEMKNTLNGITSRIDTTEEKSGKFEGTGIEIIQTKQREKNFLKSSTHKLCKNFKRPNIG